MHFGIMRWMKVINFFGFKPHPHCVFKWILRGHLKPTPNATISNMFDTDISRCINTNIKVVYLAFFGIFMLIKISVSKILAQGHL